VGAFLAHRNAVKEAGIAQRVVIIEFESVAQAIATRDGEPYRAALRSLDKAAVRL
jgi:uncharacterized protein (DUF1330 family)